MTLTEVSLRIVLGLHMCLLTTYDFKLHLESNKLYFKNILLI